MTAPLWTPSAERIAAANTTRFRAAAEARWSVALPDSRALWRFSVNEREKFWTSIIEFADLKAETWGDKVLVDGDKLPGAKWFPDARLNFAQNLLKQRGTGDAIVFRGEDKVRRRVSHNELHEKVSRLAQALKAEGVGIGDKVGAYIANMPEAIIGMLATASLGATWSSCSPDFGTDGVLDRFGQIEPKVVIAVDGYFYNGKTLDIHPKLEAIVKQLPSVRRVVVVPYASETPDISAIPNAERFDDFIGPFAERELDYAQVPFDHPLYILYSSGTTGKPKCIVHSTGGTLLKHASEHLLASDVKPGDRVFWFTTCGWMMWNWLVSSLAFGATVLLYDGSPFYPDGNTVYDFAQDERMTLFGTSAKFIDACNKAGLKPIETHDFAQLRCLGSTGSTLVPEGFDYVYNNIKKDVHLQSMSGGTDIAGCFCGGDPTLPVWRGEIQAPTPGMATDVFDPDGQPGGSRRKGRTGLHQRLPLRADGSWNDPTATRIHAAYFALPERLDARRLRRVDGPRRPRHPRPFGRHAQPRRRAHRHRRDLPPGREARRGAGVHRHRPGLGQRRPRRAVRDPARRPPARRRADCEDQTPSARQLHAPPRAGQDRPGHRHPADQVGQDHRACRPRRGARPRHQERRGAGQPGSAGAVQEPGRVGWVTAGGATA